MLSPGRATVREADESARRTAGRTEGGRRVRNAGREGLGCACRPARRGRAGPALHRPPPDPRSDLTAGLRRSSAGRTHGPPPRPHPRHRGPQRPHDARPDHRPGEQDPGRHAPPQLRGVRRPALPDGPRRTGHRPRRRSTARPDPAGHDHRLRRLAHLDPRRVRCPGLRHRHLRGRARAGDPDAAAQTVQDDGGQRRGRAPARRDRQGHHAGRHRQDRHRRRSGLRPGVPRQRHPRAVHGGPDDGLQHVDRGGCPCRHDRSGPDDVRLPRGSRARPDRRRLGCRRRRLEQVAQRRRRCLRRRGRPRRQHPHAVRHLGHQPRTGTAARRVRARPRDDGRRQREGCRAARARLHGPDCRHAAARDPGRHRVRRLLHQRPDRGPACGRRGRQGPQGRRRRADARRAGLGTGPPAGRGGGPGQGVHRGRRGVAPPGVLDVPGHEPRPARPRRAQRLDLQPQLRGPTGQGRAHPPGQPARRGSHRLARHACPVRPTWWTWSRPAPPRGASDGCVHDPHRHRGPACGAATSTPTRSSRRSTSSG